MQVDVYLLAYEDSRLAYWGYVSEFRRQQDANSMPPSLACCHRSRGQMTQASVVVGYWR